MISEENLQVIESHLGAENPAGEIRKDIPDMKITRCSESDMVEEPFRSYERFNLYLVDSSESCWKITHDPLDATGVVLAKK